MEGNNKEEAIKSMPGVSRLSVDLAVEKVAHLNQLKIPAVGLFPAIGQEKKTADGLEAINPNGLIQNAVKKIKDSVPDIGIITDVALDPYTSHGHDGILSEDGEILNDKTVEILQEQSLSLARAGADILAPSDMMDGRIGKIRAILDKNGYENVNLLSYAAKYASTFYGPFRDAIGSGTSLGRSDKKTYQMDPRNSNEALWEVALDLEEGADMVMIKPGLPYLDILKRVKETYSVPTFAYQVSGEYLMLKNLYPEEPELEREVIVESLLCFKRAGADAIFSYFSERVAGWLKNPN
tara:strand:+ start:505 stop:1389 length:885 start_codon:yes stop_codon:yes gene_type:complete